MDKKSPLVPAQRDEVVLRLSLYEEPVAAISHIYRVSERELYRWQDEFLAGGRDRLAKGSQSIAYSEKVLGQRAHVTGQLPIANSPLDRL